MKKSRDYWRIQFLGSNSKKTDTQNILRIIIDHKLDFKEKIKDLSNYKEETECSNKIIIS